MKTDLTKANLLAFANRDRSAIENHRRSHWKSLTPEDRLQITSALSQHLEAYCPTWNSKQSRIEDFENHVRLAKLLNFENEI